VVCQGGDLLINTGLHTEVDATMARFAKVTENPLKTIVFTQGHPDHVGGWSRLNAPGVETIAQANHTDVREYWRRLHPFYSGRILKLWGLFTGDIDVSYLPPEPVLTSTFIDNHSLDLGGRRFELYATPGGETTDALVVWLPKERVVFVGNLLGPMFGHVPNLYTIRGDKIRSAKAFIRSVERVLALEPEVLINGHDLFAGSGHIQEVLTKVRDAVVHLREKTIDGMNSGSDLWTLMRSVRLPPDLVLPQMHGKVPWIVRAIWEEHTGWFRYESTTELYEVPPREVWPDLAELAGSGALTDRARVHLSQGHPLQALHLTDIVLHQNKTDAAALHVRRAALENLLEASGRENFSETQWLESEIKLTGEKS
jgi:glyoxylase-like metal-dependent hydrolase (beta-lactamase superfamily II)